MSSGDWWLVATTLNNEAKLENQLIGTKLEYRVKAINKRLLPLVFDYLTKIPGQ